MTNNAETKYSPELKLPVRSLNQPINTGLTADPILPVALITAIPIALASRLMD
ncbi:hypothetical protein D3C77_798180 [compost metagenome]